MFVMGLALLVTSYLLNLFVLGQSLVMAVIYVWSQRNGYVQVVMWRSLSLSLFLSLSVCTVVLNSLVLLLY
jgi:hypothetical protein